jgi:thiamine pyrophosphokinase
VTTQQNRAVVIAGGELHTAPHVGTTDLVIAADSGYDHAVALGISVDVLVGDLDSISSAGLDHARAASVEIEQHPRDKDETDLDIAVGLAIDRGVKAIAIHGGEGGRIAHLLTVALATSHPRWLLCDVSWHTGTGIVRTAAQDHPVTFSCEPGETVTLVPIGEACGVTTEGLRWPLENACIERGSSLGVSNESISQHVRIEVGEGAVLVILEGPIPK